MDISVFFKPFDSSTIEKHENQPSQLINHVTFFTGDLEELEGKKLALIGVLEDRNSRGNSGCAKGPDRIRKEFYNLFQFDSAPDLIDLGNIQPGNEISDTYFALNQTCQILLKKGIIPIILGGSQD